LGRAPRLWDPIEIGGTQVRNRNAMTAHGPGLSPARYARFLAEGARGGTGVAPRRLPQAVLDGSRLALSL